MTDERFSIVRAADRLVLRDHAPSAAAARLGAPGLWRDVETPQGLARVFELGAPRVAPRPDAARVDDVQAALRLLAASVAAAEGARGLPDAAEPEDDLLRGRRSRPVRDISGSISRRVGASGADAWSVLDWALATADGRPAVVAMPRWMAPPGPFAAGGARGPLSEGDLRFDLVGAVGQRRAGRLVRAFVPPSSRGANGLRAVHGALRFEPRRVALRFSALGSFPRPLDPACAAWLARLAARVHATWRLVRVGLEDTPCETVVTAEVDLTGAPLELLSDLVFEARDALVVAAARLAPELEVLQAVGPASRLLGAARSAASTPRTPGVSPGAAPPPAPGATIPGVRTW